MYQNGCYDEENSNKNQSVGDTGITEESTTEVSLTTTGNKDIFGEDEIKFPFKMKKPSGGTARSIKNATDYAKKYHKNLIEGYTEIIYD